MPGHIERAWATLVSLSGGGENESMHWIPDVPIWSQSGFRSPSMCAPIATLVPRSFSAISRYMGTQYFRKLSGPIMGAVMLSGKFM